MVEDVKMVGFINISMAVYVKPFELELYMYIKVREVIKYGYNLHMICTVV